jgi:hypothetical protein
MLYGDLRDLNVLILDYAGQPFSYSQPEIAMLQSCIGKLEPDAGSLTEALKNSSGMAPQNTVHNTPATITINTEYLRFARQVARDICNGCFEGLVTLDIDAAQANVLASLTNKQITYLSETWLGAIFRVEGPMLTASCLHAKALPHYLVARATSCHRG